MEYLFRFQPIIGADGAMIGMAAQIPMPFAKGVVDGDGGGRICGLAQIVTIANQ
jgi:hypothetical protein